MKKRLVVALMAWSTVLFTADSWSAGGATLFVQECGHCHRKGGKAAPVNPADKASVVWEKYFARRRHPVDFEKTFSPEELDSILRYLKSHAADSDQPAVAVIPN